MRLVGHLAGGCRRKERKSRRHDGRNGRRWRFSAILSIFFETFGEN